MYAEKKLKSLDGFNCQLTCPLEETKVHHPDILQAVNRHIYYL